MMQISALAQNIAVALLVLGAIVYLCRASFSRRKGCGSGCCGKSREGDPGGRSSR